MDACFTIGYGDHVIVNLSLFEVCINAHKFQVMGTLLEPTTVLEHLFQANSSIASGPNGPFTPLTNTLISNQVACAIKHTYRSINELVAFAWIFVNLLDPTGPRALEGNHGRLPWEY